MSLRYLSSLSGTWTRMLLAAVFVCTVVMVDVGWADPINVTILTELMIEVQGSDVGMLLLSIDQRGSDVIHFTSSVDIMAQTFHFEVIPGATLYGLPLTLSTSAVFDPNTDMLTYTGSGQLGAATFSTAGKQDVNRLVNPP